MLTLVEVEIYHADDFISLRPSRVQMTFYCPQCQKKYRDGEFEVCPDDGARLFRVDPSAGKATLLGAVIDERFRIDELLGAGGMGAVYRGVQLSVQREVAIKVLRPDLADKEEFMSRFFREAKVVSELTHPNVVRLFEFGQDQERDLLYLVMELVRGVGLDELILRGRLNTEMALEITYQICGALTEPHARGIIHRDLKPENLEILPVSDGTIQVKVLDFGIAQAVEEGTKITKTGMMCGTPSYMSPERAQDVEADSRADLYALGVILFEMLTGQLPFDGESSLKIIFNHIFETPADLSVAMPNGLIPDEVSALVADLLEKKREDRPSSARAVRDRIDEIRKNLAMDGVRLSPDQGDDIFGDWILPLVKLKAPTPVESTQERLRGATLNHWEMSTRKADSVEGSQVGTHAGTMVIDRAQLRLLVDEGGRETVAAASPVEPEKVAEDRRGWMVLALALSALFFVLLSCAGGAMIVAWNIHQKSDAAASANVEEAVEEDEEAEEKDEDEVVEGRREQEREIERTREPEDVSPLQEAVEDELRQAVEGFRRNGRGKGRERRRR